MHNLNVLVVLMIPLPFASKWVSWLRLGEKATAFYRDNYWAGFWDMMKANVQTDFPWINDSRFYLTYGGLGGLACWLPAASFRLSIEMR